MKILILEDRGSVAYYMAEALEFEGHKVTQVFSIPDARTILKDDGIECIIIDLNMDPWGLSEDQKNETRDGQLTGWIWLRDEVIKDKPQMRNRIIIYSEYIQALTSYVSIEELTGLCIISKSGSSSPAEQVLKCVNAINRLKRE